MEIVKPYFLTEHRSSFLPLINQNKYFFFLCIANKHSENVDVGRLDH